MQIENETRGMFGVGQVPSACFSLFNFSLFPVHGSSVYSSWPVVVVVVVGSCITLRLGLYGAELL